MQAAAENYSQPTESASSANSSVTPSGESSKNYQPKKIMNHGANSSIGGVPLGSISPKSTLEGSSEPVSKQKKHNKRNKKNKGSGAGGGRES